MFDSFSAIPSVSLHWSKNAADSSLVKTRTGVGSEGIFFTSSDFKFHIVTSLELFFTFPAHPERKAMEIRNTVLKFEYFFIDVYFLMAAFGRTPHLRTRMPDTQYAS